MERHRLLSTAKKKTKHKHWGLNRCQNDRISRPLVYMEIEKIKYEAYYIKIFKNLTRSQRLHG